MAKRVLVLTEQAADVLERLLPSCIDEMDRLMRHRNWQADRNGATDLIALRDVLDELRQPGAMRKVGT